MLHFTLFYSTDMSTELDLRTFKDLPNKIQGLSMIWALFNDFPVLENETKNSMTFTDPWEPELKMIMYDTRISIHEKSAVKLTTSIRMWH